MKKTRLLIAMLVCAVMLMGVGYAWWTDSVAIGSTVATGEMNVHFENTSGYPYVLASEYVEASVEADECSKSITCEFNKLYPGAIGVIDAKIKNDSTIPVKLDKASIVVDIDAELAPHLQTYAYFFQTDANDNYIDGTFGYTDIVALDQLANALNRNTTLQNITLEPGDKLYFGVPDEEEPVYDLDNDGEKEKCIVFGVSSAAGNDTQNTSASFTLTLDWKQFNQW
jgi:hypothetical protein